MKKYLLIKYENLCVFSVLRGFIKIMFLLIISYPLHAHHVLGRPSYSLNEDSTTPPSMQEETQIGNYYVTYMVFPAFPAPNEPGRVNLYISSKDTGEPYTGKVVFKAKSGNLFSNKEELLGTQLPDDNVFRQGYQFHEAGNYTIKAEFESDGKTHQLDFPLKIGDPEPFGPTGLIIAIIILVTISVNIFKRKNVLIEKIRSYQNKNINHKILTDQK